MTSLKQELALLPERIDRDEAWLDEKYPGWEKKIDPDSLDMSNYCECILSQAIGGYDARSVLLPDQMAYLGLDLPTMPSFYYESYLAAAETQWLERIAKKAQQVQQKTTGLVFAQPKRGMA